VGSARELAVLARGAARHFQHGRVPHAIERMEPRHYLAASYYERSLTSLATLCVEKGV
jgi:nitrile hydratase